MASWGLRVACQARRARLLVASRYQAGEGAGTDPSRPSGPGKVAFPPLMPLCVKVHLVPSERKAAVMIGDRDHRSQALSSHQPTM